MYPINNNTIVIIAGISILRHISMAAPFQSRLLLSEINTRKVVMVSAVYVALSLIHIPISYGHVTYPSGDNACTALVTGSSSTATYYVSEIRPWQVRLAYLLSYLVYIVKQHFFGNFQRHCDFGVSKILLTFH